MAYLYKRDRSPFFWIEFQDVTGKRCQKSTGLRHAVTLESRKARAMCAKMTASEKAFTATDSEAWAAWVDRFLVQRYGHTPSTLARYRGSWRNVEAFLRINHILVPRQLTRQHVRDFVDWRQERHADAGCYEASKNTALHEVKLLRIVMFEALQCGYSDVNPAQRLGTKPDKAAQKPRITDAEHAKILKALEQEPEWMRVSYLIAWHQGCRFSETCLHIPTQVDLREGIIRFRTKGHKDKLAEFPLNPDLAPLFRQMIAEGREWTFNMPKMPGKAFWLFFKRIRLSHLCFHCTRVTFVTRAYENGIPKEMVMRLVGHASELVHAIYPRLTVDRHVKAAMQQAIGQLAKPHLQAVA